MFWEKNALKNQWTWNMNAKYLKVMKDYVQRIEEHFTIQNVWTSGGRDYTTLD